MKPGKNYLVCTLFSLVTLWLIYTNGLISDVELLFYILDITQNCKFSINIPHCLVVKDLLGF